MCMILAGCLGASQMALAGNGWRNVGGEGDRHFVVVDAATVDNPGVYRDAASSLCKPARTCVVMFWNDERLAATRMPLTSEQAAALAAQFTRNPTTGNERLHFRCRGGEPAGTCLK
jgi:hypothetical protein